MAKSSERSEPPTAPGTASSCPKYAGGSAQSARGAAPPDPASLLLETLAQHALTALGTLPADPAFCPSDAQALMLVGPMGGDIWWSGLKANPEWQDGQPDPVDRWSRRTLTAIATLVGGTALFPSDGPPYPPFLHWARATGQMWQSPVGMLVHAQAGLWVSFRGALALPFALPLPAATNPCNTCHAQPCRTACPVNALGAGVYDTHACHGFLDSPAGRDCLSRGCAARRACPAGESHARLDDQSAYHMRQFHP